MARSEKTGDELELRDAPLAEYTLEEVEEREASERDERADAEREAELRGGREEAAYAFHAGLAGMINIAWEDAKTDHVRIKFREVGTNLWYIAPSWGHFEYGDAYTFPDPYACTDASWGLCNQWWGQAGLDGLKECTEYEVKVQYKTILWHRVADVFTASTNCPPPCEPVVTECAPTDCGTIWNGCPSGLFCGPCECPLPECWCWNDDTCSTGGTCPDNTVCPL